MSSFKFKSGFQNVSFESLTGSNEVQLKIAEGRSLKVRSNV